MTFTAEEPTTVETPSLASPSPSKPPISLGVIVGWVALGVAFVAAGLLAVAVVTDDNGRSTIDTGRTVAEHGSVSAIDHRDALGGRALARTVAERGSINAIEHRDALRGRAPARTVAEHGSISAIDHRDALRG